LNMKLTAKGVETEAELGFLRRNHCDLFLGHLFSPPLPAELLDPLVQKRFLPPAAFAATRPERTLLLPDDWANVLRALVRLFRRDGYKVLTASTVREAFDLLASNPVQVIVSDQRMPDMSGTEFLAKVRELYPDTVRMVLSGYTDLATITEAINRGSIYRFLTKPWNDDELRGHIEATLRAHVRQGDAEIPAYLASWPRAPSPPSPPWRGCTTGRTTRKVVPTPCSLCTSIRPWCLDTMLYAIARRSPVPRPIGLLASNGAGIRGSTSGPIPQPLPAMLSRAGPPSA